MDASLKEFRQDLKASEAFAERPRSWAKGTTVCPENSKVGPEEMEVAGDTFEEGWPKWRRLNQLRPQWSGRSSVMKKGTWG
jgi:hypothetical protein